MERHQLLSMVDWDNVMKASRDAGGHEDVMQKVFYEHIAVVFASWIEKDYQGNEIFAYLFKDGYIVIIQDSFGSCSGCDSWKGASDEDAKRLITTMVDSARIYKNIDEVLNYMENVDSSDYFGQYLINIKEDMIKYKKIIKDMSLDEAPLYINSEDKIIKFIAGYILGF